ncbi:MAG TPA: pyruvate, phosphate dikinase [Candidatus Polarisedimenticolia bacterium]|nr:pyruvate, phosphate dikinase [Candidatus Polarisedimenticolia bacterium]
MKKMVYLFGEGKAEGNRDMKELLGGKGANLAEMSNLGLPVPPGFTITTEVCLAYLERNAYPEGLAGAIDESMAWVERSMKQRFGDPARPLLVSCRSGARASMPGMMDTVLNIGLNDTTLRGLIEASGDERFALDCYRRLIEMYGDVVMRVKREHYHHALEEAKRTAGVQEDRHLQAEALRGVIERYKAITREHAGRPFPETPRDQIQGAVEAVFRSWNGARAREYRRIHSLPDDWGTAVNVQAMVFGNLGDDCGTGVAFTRSPATGEKGIYGEFLPNAQGEDVVAGIRTPQPIRKGAGSGLPSLEETMPAIFTQLLQFGERLERHYREMQDIEFTIMKGRLYTLQTRRGARTGQAGVRIAVEMAREKLVDEQEAVLRVDAERMSDLLAPAFEPTARDRAVKEGRLLARGLNAGPGAACGRVALTAETAFRMAREGRGPGRDPVILVRAETSPEDIKGMEASVGILTARGGMTSHAAVVARGMGKPCIVGCGAISIAPDGGSFHVGATVVKEGDFLSIDGSTGEVILGALPTSASEVLQVLVDRTLDPSASRLYGDYAALMSWADKARTIGVRANSDTPVDSRAARLLGAEGIGLCRTEHMFFGSDRVVAVREMILAQDEAGRRRALQKILPMQRQDFVEIFTAMQGLPVTIRLLDPPLHEFLPHAAAQIEEVARAMGVPADTVRERVESLSEANPMLGHRGCRLGLTYPEIYEMQVQAIFEAACQAAASGVEVHPEVMHPLVGTFEELRRLRDMTVTVAGRVMKETGTTVPYLVGTMIEVPRACLAASEIAQVAQFFSFGTNDLTQMTFGYSRDDTRNFLPFYVSERILPGDPFQSIDLSGVGRLVQMAVQAGRKAQPKLKVGVCGEHGGDPASVVFFHDAGLDYVSCSPYRIPVARLAAAQAALRRKTA